MYTLLLPLVLLGAPNVGLDAKSEAPAGTAKRDGFYLRVGAGLAAGGLRTGLPDEPLPASRGGVGPGFTLSGGWAVTPEWVAHVDMMSYGPITLDFDIFCSSDAECDPPDEVVSRGTRAWGAGATRYFDDGFFASGSLLAAQVGYRTRGEGTEFRSGPGLTASLGKEWVGAGGHAGFAVALTGAVVRADEGWGSESVGLNMLLVVE